MIISETDVWVTTQNQVTKSQKPSSLLQRSSVLQLYWPQRRKGFGREQLPLWHSPNSPSEHWTPLEINGKNDYYSCSSELPNSAHTHMCNSSRRCIMAAFSTRLSPTLLPMSCFSSCPSAAFFLHSASNHCAICTRLLFPPTLWSPSSLSYLHFWIRSPRSRAQRRGSSWPCWGTMCPMPLRKGRVPSLALLTGRGCWQGVRAHTSSSLEKLTTSCHMSDHLQTGLKMHNHRYIYKGTTSGTTCRATNTLYCPGSQMGRWKIHIFLEEKNRRDPSGGLGLSLYPPCPLSFLPLLPLPAPALQE